MKLRIIKSFLAVTILACVIYKLAKPDANSSKSKETAYEAPGIVILGKENAAKVKEVADTIQEEDGDVMTLDDFLDLLICGGCNRQCSLLAPYCGKGMQKAETQTEYYAEAVALISGEV